MIEHPQHLLHPNLEKHWHDHAQGPPPEGTVKGGRSKWWAMGAIAPAILICAFDMTTLNVALPDLTRSLDASTSDLQWILDSYTIVLAGFLLFAQGIADRFGRKGTYVTGLAIFGIASFTAAFTTTSEQLIAARAVMGIGAALLLSPTLAMIAVIFPPEERPRAVAIWVIFGGVGTALGPVLGGLLVEEFGWGAAFLINVPVVIAAITISVIVLPTSRKPGDVHLDVIGMLLSIFGLGILLYGVIEGPALGWGSPRTIGAIVVGLALTIGFFVWELKNPNPMFDPRVFKIPGVIAGATALFAIYITFLGMIFLIPQYLQFVEEKAALVAGLLMLPFGIMFIIGAQLVPKTTKRFGVRTTLVIALLSMAIGLLVLAAINGTDSTTMVLLGSALFGLGVGHAVGPATTAVVNALPIEKAGDGSSVNMLMRQSGAAFGIAIVGSVFAAVYATTIAPFADKLGTKNGAEVSKDIQSAEQVASTLGTAKGAAVNAAADNAFLAGSRAGLLVAAGAALVAAAIVVLALRGRAEAAPLPEPALDAGT